MTKLSTGIETLKVSKTILGLSLNSIATYGVTKESAAP